MKYIILIALFFLPFFLTALSGEKALSEKDTIVAGIEAIRAQHTDPRAACAVIKAWKEANQAALDSVEAQAAALRGLELTPLEPVVLSEGLSKEECTSYAEAHAINTELLDLRKQYENATAVECCSAIKAWRMTKQSRLDDLETLMRSH